MQIEHWDPAKDGKLSEATMRRKLEARGYVVSKYVYGPGTYFPAHDHGADKIDAVLSGQFRMTVGAQSLVLRPGDILAVRKHVIHSAEVVGGEPVVSLDAVKYGSDET